MSKLRSFVDGFMRGRATRRGVAALFSKEKNNAARALFERALAIDPSNVEAIQGVASTYGTAYLMGWGEPGTDYDARVLGPLDRAIALDSNYVDSYVDKGFYLVQSRRPDEALRVAEAGLALNPNITSLYMARAFGKLDLGRFDEAKSDMQQGIRLSPRDPFVTFFFTPVSATQKLARVVQKLRSRNTVNRSTPAITPTGTMQTSPPPTRS